TQEKKPLKPDLGVIVEHKEHHQGGGRQLEEGIRLEDRRGRWSVFFIGIDILYDLHGIGLPDIPGTPSGGHEPDPDLVPWRTGPPGILAQPPKVLEIDDQRIPGMYGFEYPVLRGHMVQFLLEGPEHPVPYAENVSEVLIDLLRID